MKQFKYRIYDTVYDDIVSGKKQSNFVYWMINQKILVKVIKFYLL